MLANLHGMWELGSFVNRDCGHKSRGAMTWFSVNISQDIVSGFLGSEKSLYRLGLVGESRDRQMLF